jgi:GntR family transcriptional regulator
MVAAGELEPGDKLRSERQMMLDYGVARGTIKLALKTLAAEGLIVSEHGRGSFVRPRPPITRSARQRFRRSHRDNNGKAAFLAEAEADGRVPSVEMLRIGAPDPVPVWAAEKLDLATGDPVLTRYRIYYSDGEPEQLATSYVPWALAEGTRMVDENPGPGGIYKVLEDGGHRLERFTETVSARMPTPDEAKLLDLPLGVPLLILVRTAFDTTGRPVEICDTIKAANRWECEYEWSADS